jgi:hypothetical protein
MLHDILKHEAIIRMFKWMLHDILKCRVKYQNVQVNVTWYSEYYKNVYLNVTRYSKVQSKLSKCLSECYTIFLSAE